MEKPQSSKFGEAAKETPNNSGSLPHKDYSPRHVEREDAGADFFVDFEDKSFNAGACRLGSSVVGLEGNGGFNIGSGISSKRSNKRRVLGPKISRAQSQPIGLKETSPGDVRPKKRPGIQ
ncbi:hypothetical protein Hanom_Chr06g00560421 [Helianthus anomalus]